MSEEQDTPAWHERVVEIAGAVGMNQVRVRWKLRRWHERRLEEARRREQRAGHIRYEHKTCEGCGAINDRGARSCERCGERLASRTAQVLRRLGLSMPRALSVSVLLALIIAGVYARTIAAAGIDHGLALPMDVLYRFGGHFPPAVEAGEAWRWLTAMFLHAGVWHLAFNLLALAVVGPQVEEEYGRATMLALFLITGVAANAGSMALGLDALSIGASGGVMGLVGLAAGRGQRQGTPRGRTQRDDMLKWSLYVFVFGFLVGADTRAHVVGLVAGAGLGYALEPRWLESRSARPVTRVVQLSAAVTLIATVAVIVAR